MKSESRSAMGVASIDLKPYYVLAPKPGLVIIKGPPGSGKSTMARRIMACATGVVFPLADVVTFKPPELPVDVEKSSRGGTLALLRPGLIVVDGMEALELGDAELLGLSMHVGAVVVGTRRSGQPARLADVEIAVLEGTWRMVKTRHGGHTSGSVR